MFGIPSSTLRFYEKEGILPKNSRMQAVIVAACSRQNPCDSCSI
ncbi:MerR family DNA-binding transcriptional regulator [Bacillus inaquosorum]